MRRRTSRTSGAGRHRVQLAAPHYYYYYYYYCSAGCFLTTTTILAPSVTD